MLVHYCYLCKMKVYIIQCLDYFKVGISKDISKRMIALQTSNPVKLKLIAYLDSKESASIEKEIHKDYSNYNSSGEWFKLTPVIIRQIIKKYGFIVEATPSKIDYSKNKLLDDYIKRVERSENNRSRLDRMARENWKRLTEKELRDNIEINIRKDMAGILLSDMYFKSKINN